MYSHRKVGPVVCLGSELMKKNQKKTKKKKMKKKKKKKKKKNQKMKKKTLEMKKPSSVDYLAMSPGQKD